MEGKVCSKCHKLKPYSAFSKQCRSKDGYRPRCKECTSDDNKEWYAEGGGKESEKQRHAVYYRLNTEKEATRCKVKATMHPEGNRKRSNCWRKNNLLHAREIGRNKTQRYKAIKNKLVSDLTIEQWQYTLKVLGNECIYCGGANEAQEHIVPVTKGGGYTFRNIVPSCKKCNSSKSNKDMIGWYSAQSFFSEDRLLRLVKFIAGKEVSTPRDRFK